MQYGCRTLRDGLIVAAVFLAMGAAMLAAARWTEPVIPVLGGLAQALGLLCLALAPLIVAGSWLRTGRRRGRRPALHRSPRGAS